MMHAMQCQMHIRLGVTPRVQQSCARCLIVALLCLAERLEGDVRRRHGV